MNIGQFNARGPYNGDEHWFDLIYEEFIKRGHKVRQFWLRGKQPKKEDIEWMDFVIFHFSQVALYYRRIGVPFCIMPSANDCFPDNGAKLKVAASHKNCKFVTYQSMYHLKKYKEWDIPKPKVYVPHPVRTNLFKRKTPYNPSGGLVAGGRLIPKKGLDRLKGVENLTIFGDGLLKEKLHNRLHEANFTGHLSGEQLKDLFEQSSIYLFPAIVTPDGDSEGISNTIKEAMLMELPVICTTVAGNKEFENVIHLDDWSKINYLLENKNIRQRNWKGRQEILRIYSPKTCVNMLLGGIEEYVNG